MKTAKEKSAKTRRSTRLCLPLAPHPSALSLHAKNLLQGRNDIDEVGLRRHHGIDVLVRRRDLVDHAFVLATFDAGRLERQVLASESLAGLSSAHASARAVRARGVRRRLALAAHDKALRAHRARNDAQFAGAGAHRTLARHPNALAEVLLDTRVVVMTVGHFTYEANVTPQALCKRLVHEVQHQIAVERRVLLRPTEPFHVRLEFRRPLVKPRKVAMRQAAIDPFGHFLRHVHRALAYGVADIA